MTNHPCYHFNHLTTAEHLQAAFDHLSAALGEDPCPDAPILMEEPVHEVKKDPFYRNEIKQHRHMLELIQGQLRDQLAGTSVEAQLREEAKQRLVRKMTSVAANGSAIKHLKDTIAASDYPDARLVLTASGYEIAFPDEEKAV